MIHTPSGEPEVSPDPIPIDDWSGDNPSSQADVEIEQGHPDQGALRPLDHMQRTEGPPIDELLEAEQAETVAALQEALLTGDDNQD